MIGKIFLFFVFFILAIYLSAYLGFWGIVVSGLLFATFIKGGD